MTNQNTLPKGKNAAKASFGSEIDLFTKHIDAIGHVLIGMVVALQEASKRSQNKLVSFEDRVCNVVENDQGRTVTIPSMHVKEWRGLKRKYEHFGISRGLLPRSLLVSLISQYDAYLGRILRTIFVRKPEILNSADKQISFEMLSKFASIDAAREYVLEKEVENILRSSHAEQFKWMENTFKLPLTKDLEIWPAFMEITERRNLFVHTDGMVSSQYMTVCKLHKCTLDESINEGDRLDVPQGYFNAAHKCIYEIGVKLGHVLWRKLFPDEREAADDNYNRLTYDLIENGKFDLAIRLLDFGCNEFKKFSNEINELVMTVNRAQAYKWNGQEEICRKIMRNIDWSAKGDQFRIANFALAEDWESVRKVMVRIGRDGPVSMDCYRDWPLFVELRKQEIFLTTYEEIFGEKFGDGLEVKKTEIPSSAEESAMNEGNAEADEIVGN